MDSQEALLDNCLKNVRTMAYQIHNSIDQNNLRQCLKDTNALLLELKTSKLYPRNYYHLYTAIFDEMQGVQNFFKEELARGRTTKDLYTSVQQAAHVIPRIYLMITAAAVCIEKEPPTAREKIFDILQMIKGVQNPTRGLFARYFLLKTIKDKLPDKGNEYTTDSSSIDDTYRFILQNFEEMNDLWIRLSANKKLDPSANYDKNKERKDLQVLVGDNITRLSSLEGLDLQTYKNNILPKLLQIIVNAKEKMSQQYLLECIIQAFSDDYNIPCMKLILDTIFQLDKSIDSKSLLIEIMEKIAKSESDNNSNGEQASSEKKQNYEDILKLLLEKIEKVLKDTSALVVKEENIMISTLKLVVAYMKFNIKCSCPEEKLNRVNHILAEVLKLLSSLNQIGSKKIIKLIENLLTAPLESELSFFDFPDFSALLKYLDFPSKNSIALHLIESFTKNNSQDTLDTPDKIKFLFDSLNTLLYDEADGTYDDPIQFEFEQNQIVKLLFTIHNSSPEIMYNSFVLLKDIFLKGGAKRQSFTLPALVNIITNFCFSLGYGFDCMNNLIQLNENDNNIREHLSQYNFQELSADNLSDFLMKNYTLLNEIITAIGGNDLYRATQCYLLCSTHVNQIQLNKEKYVDAGLSFINAALQIYNDNKYDGSLKQKIFNEIISALIQAKILNPDLITQIINSLQTSTQTMPKRGDQCYAMLDLCDAYYFALNDKTKVLDCLKKAKRFADFAMTTPTYLDLFVIIINKVIFYIQHDSEDIVPAEFIEEIIEAIKNHIETIKSENAKVDNLAEIEEYYQRTMKDFQTIVSQLNRQNYMNIKA
ncbi:MAG: vacuolar protein sorting-associated protein 35 [archaeon]|nr:vacuolar protein sorting-associated protein 35 [archaeon]